MPTEKNEDKQLRSSCKKIGINVPITPTTRRVLQRLVRKSAQAAQGTKELTGSTPRKEIRTAKNVTDVDEYITNQEISAASILQTRSGVLNSVATQTADRQGANKEENRGNATAPLARNLAVRAKRNEVIDSLPCNKDDLKDFFKRNLENWNALNRLEEAAGDNPADASDENKPKAAVEKVHGFAQFLCAVVGVLVLAFVLGEIFQYVQKK